ncbi:MAG: ATP-binding protein, partial [Hydrogenovibrio sp.]|uniref:hybrid sensor histidine kinase/response regulator n=1 Tax=Hydrogenovibrio sp. TaxID=2065821 RepID=UPI00286FEF93
MRDHKGNPLKMLGVVQDINDRKVAEFKLQEREQLLLEAQHLASLGNWRANLITGELYWSDEIFRIFGYEPNSFSPTVSDFKAAVHPDDIELVEQDMKNAELTGRHDVIHRILLPDGKVRYVHELAQMQYDDSGKACCLAGTVQDVTDLKKAEQDLLVFRRIFDSTDQGIGVTNAEGHLLYSNPAHDDLHGYEPGECLGEHFNIFFSEKTKQWANDTIMSAISEGRGWSGILPIVRKDGREVITASNVGFIADDKGNLQYLFNIMSDYGPELERQNQLENAREEAEQANQAKSEFLSSMSHELRTPLNAILGFGQVLQYDDRMHPDQQGSVQEILSGGKHLLELINEVLDLAKIESGHLELRIASLELCSLVKECMTLIKPLADKRGIEVSHEGIGGLMIKADRTRLKQVLLNLLSNAVKYNREEGRVHIHIQNDERDQLRIGVSDTGEGLSEDQVAQLFQAFNRLDFKNSKVEGTGIGLTITKRIVEMMDGEIDVESKVGVGTTFWVDLPVGDEKETSLSRKASAPQATSETHDKPASQHTLLYIEDNASNLKLVEKILGHKANLTLLTAETPEKGIELAFKRFPSLILLDINMPRMDGYKVLKVLQSNPKLNKTPVIAITANAMGHDIERGKEAGFVDYLTKPLDVEQFLSAIDRQLNP